MTSAIKYLVLPFLLLTGLCSSVWGQSTTSVRGYVTDPSGAGIPDAKVHITRIDTNASRDTATDKDGFYQFLQLAPGAYKLSASASGFTTVEQLDLNLIVSLPASLDFHLTIATSAERIEVTSALPMLNTTDATLGNSFDTAQVEQLPIEARNVVELLSLEPGVSFLGNRIDANKDTRSGAVNGARSDQSNVSLDGVDVNDQNNGYAFESVLRNTQDSVSEFRVTTSNANADAGRSAGAQVALVTKSGSNQIHGSVYEYNRNTALSANEYFLKLSELQNGQPNKRSQLIRNLFGASLGGPVLKDRFFFFLNYEGRHDREAVSVVQTVPTASLRAGNLIYYLDQPHTQAFTLTPSDIQQMDPQGIGNNAAITSLLQNYPLPNDFTQGDKVNTAGLRFAASEARRFDTYIARFDYVLTSKQTLFWRGNLQGDHQSHAPQFPGQPPAVTELDNSKGFAIGYSAVLSPTKVNVLHYGFTRQSGGKAGISDQPQVTLSGLSDPVAFTRTSVFHVPVQDLNDNFSWSRGNHSLQFGGYFRFIGNYSSSGQNSFPSAHINSGWLVNSGIANRGVPFDPAQSNFPAVTDNFARQYDSILMTLVGMVTEGDAVYNYSKTGAPSPIGTALVRDYRWHELEPYAEDSWKITRRLTLTFGLRWTLLQPPAEARGNQVGPCTVSGNRCTPFSLTDYLSQSAAQGRSGGAAISVPELSFAPNGRYNGQSDFWGYDYHNFAPRIAVAWSPEFSSRLLSGLFGDAGKTSIRAGYGIYYSHFGAATVNSYNAAGSFGLSSQVQNVPGTVSVSTAPRFTGISDIPPGLLPSAPAGGFPATPASNAFAISWGLDRNMKTPYSHAMDFSISRELGKTVVVDVAYVGRFSRRLPEQMDVAMPLNYVDPASHVDYFTAATILSKLAHAGVPIANVQPVPYWENLFGPLAGTDLGAGPLTATQVVYSQFLNNVGNETFALFTLDLPNSQSGAGLNVPGHQYPSYRFYHDQYSALYTWRTIGDSSYNALQVTLQKRFSDGLQGALNYTFSKSLDWTSQAERIPTSGGNNQAQIINTWQPNQLRGRSDFNPAHQINANWIYELPVGRGRRWASDSNRVINAIVGGWQLSGIFRWTSGFPWSVDEGSTWPTNWDIEGWAVLDGHVPSQSLQRGSGANAFSDSKAVFNAFRVQFPGESGTRNPLTGDGYFGIDTGLSKLFHPTERIGVRFRWDVFNLTNSVRFDVNTIGNRLDQSDTFGVYTHTLTNPRVIQVALRVEF
jgi:hypothetical protein